MFFINNVRLTRDCPSQWLPCLKISRRELVDRKNPKRRKIGQTYVYNNESSFPIISVSALLKVRDTTVQCSTVRYSAVRYSTARFSTVRYNAVAYSAVRFSAVQCVRTKVSRCLPWESSPPVCCGGSG